MVVHIRTVETEGKGRLSFFEGLRDIPFEVKRAHYLCKAPEEIVREGAFVESSSQLLVCTFGSIEVVFEDEGGRNSVLLDDPAKGLLLQGLAWRELRWLKEDSVLMVVSSDRYDGEGCSCNRAMLNQEIVEHRFDSARGINPVEMRKADDGIVIDGGFDIPFDVRRVYYIYDVPKGVMRGGHAHRDLEQLLVCTHGSIEISFDNGAEQSSILLDDPAKGLLVGSMVWRDMRWVEEGSVLSVLASGYYDEADYIRDYDTFEREVVMRRKGDQFDGR